MGGLGAGGVEDAGGGAASARDRILRAAGELFTEVGFDATPTSRIAERAGVPKGLVHYYFRHKPDLLAALVQRLPEELVDHRRVVVPGDVAESLRRLVAALDARLGASWALSRLLWREADRHEAVREALRRRFARIVEQVRGVITAARPPTARRADVDSAAGLLAAAVSYRHTLARRGERVRPLERELSFLADALTLGAGCPRPPVTGSAAPRGGSGSPAPGSAAR
ncbi:transcriptional regulator, TetR family [Streptoalloteichus tenebrarius]|uniref:Transcriptional regulator, TetR family n=1 Tax=Streptoalloteichus tenebrarius (strain ATCC 17920 / DSM 40477 / JCM 4838 / CBS 697.72 / NBRC 16177 / NCIMB 11028 / NRRL B-12390 / A12253. 1 / ISP 5477) TaxID=1933 RepID=A0ABT1HZU1_STRSD|nr:TetR/AcrR family transcriptional regulator [Streptoalloteichus tenebrarius]MCP2261026.1 transcriptional regulator, TetR family [Streptoalloteichus tenebrarius]